MYGDKPGLSPIVLHRLSNERAWGIRITAQKGVTALTGQSEEMAALRGFLVRNFETSLPVVAAIFSGKVSKENPIRLEKEFPDWSSQIETEVYAMAKKLPKEQLAFLDEVRRRHAFMENLRVGY